MARLTLVPHPDHVPQTQTVQTGWSFAWLLGVPIQVLLLVWLFAKVL